MHIAIKIHFTPKIQVYILPYLKVGGGCPCATQGINTFCPDLTLTCCLLCTMVGGIELDGVVT